MSYEKYVEENRCSLCGAPPRKNVYAPEDGGCRECGARNYVGFGRSDSDALIVLKVCASIVSFLLALGLVVGFFYFLWAITTVGF